MYSIQLLTPASLEVKYGRIRKVQIYMPPCNLSDVLHDNNAGVGVSLSNVVDNIKRTESSRPTVNAL